MIFSNAYSLIQIFWFTLHSTLFLRVQLTDKNALFEAIGTKFTYVRASYQISKITGWACAGNADSVFSRRRLQRKPLVSDPGMHHGTCVTLTRAGGVNVPGIPGACAPTILRNWQEAHGIKFASQGPNVLVMSGTGDGHCDVMGYLRYTQYFHIITTICGALVIWKRVSLSLPLIDFFQ